MLTEHRGTMGCDSTLANESYLLNRLQCFCQMLASLSLAYHSLDPASDSIINKHMSIYMFWLMLAARSCLQPTPFAAVARASHRPAAQLPQQNHPKPLQVARCIHAESTLIESHVPFSAAGAAHTTSLAPLGACCCCRCTSCCCWGATGQLHSCEPWLLNTGFLITAGR
jgi:hypothetical protein